MGDAQKSPWHKLLDTKLSRRDVMQSALAAGVAASMPRAFAQETDAAVGLNANNGAPVTTPQGAAGDMHFQPPFTPIESTFADTMTLPEGYRAQIFLPWGQPLTEAGDEIGFNHDFVGFFPIDFLEGGNSASEGLLTINHEYPNALFVGGNTSDRTAPEQVDAEMRSVGVSVAHVRRSGDSWELVPGVRNRRITALTECELTGPVRGTPPVNGATTVQGTVGNCSGGQTPWSTLLTCEENVDDYQLIWGSAGYNAMHQGWITEIDPYTPGATPRKRTAMGRFRHENAAVTVAPDGRVVVYMGDDMRDACVYKFVSRGRFVPGNRAANLDLLEEGDLYVANFGRGEWLLLDYDRNPALQEATGDDDQPLVASQAEVLADARAAALAIGGTPVDRPEDIEIHPLTGDVYIALTNNSNHGNYYGQIVRLFEGADAGTEQRTAASSDWTAEQFRWDVFAVGGPQSGFSSPDNLVFDPYGNLWMVTDSGTGEGTIYEFLGNNSMFFFPTQGPDAGTPYRFAVGPVDSELTGPVWTPDGKTLFLAVQHPGENSESIDDLTSTFGASPDSSWPRPTLVAITGFPGWGS